MIKLRIDDILNQSSAFSPERSEHRFRQKHRWITQVPGKIIHVPVIIVKDIEKFPAVIEFIKEETKEGRMSPQIHGLEHIDYGTLSLITIEDHLKQCLEWFDEKLNVKPTTWCTPWGGWSYNMKKAADKFYLDVETTHPTIKPSRAIELCKDIGVDNLVKNNPIVLDHWYDKGLNILRLVEIVKYGSYPEAAENRPDLFKG